MYAKWYCWFGRAEYKKRAKRSVSIFKAEVKGKLYQNLDSSDGQKHPCWMAKLREKNRRDIPHANCIKDDNRRPGRELTIDEEIKRRRKIYF